MRRTPAPLPFRLIRKLLDALGYQLCVSLDATIVEVVQNLDGKFFIKLLGQGVEAPVRGLLEVFWANLEQLLFWSPKKVKKVGYSRYTTASVKIRLRTTKCQDDNWIIS